MSSIPHDNLAYPVLVTLDSGITATGFYYRNKSGVYFITARHVLLNREKEMWKLNAPRATLISYSLDLDWEKPSKALLDLDVIMEEGRLKFNDSDDVVVLKICSVVEEGDDKYVISKPLKGASTDREFKSVTVPPGNIRYFSEVEEGNDVYLFGYPTSIGLRNDPQIKYNKPLLRKGTIAQKNDDRKTIILDCPVYFGNSGGPVTELVKTNINRHTFPIIGVVSQYVPFVQEWLNLKQGHTNIEYDNSGYSVIVPMDAVIKHIDSLEE